MFVPDEHKKKVKKSTAKKKKSTNIFLFLNYYTFCFLLHGKKKNKAIYHEIFCDHREGRFLQHSTKISQKKTTCFKIYFFHHLYSTSFKSSFLTTHTIKNKWLQVLRSNALHLFSNRLSRQRLWSKQDTQNLTSLLTRWLSWLFSLACTLLLEVKRCMPF